MTGFNMSTIAGALMIATESIALIEAIKNFFKQKQAKAPAWIYTILSFIFCFGLAALQADSYTPGALVAQAEVGLLALAFAQLGYDSIYKGLQTALKRLNGDAGPSKRAPGRGGENE